MSRVKKAEPELKVKPPKGPGVQSAVKPKRGAGESSKRLPDEVAVNKNPLAGVEFANLKVSKISIAKLLGIGSNALPNLERRGILRFHPAGHMIEGYVDVVRTVRAYCAELRENGRDTAQNWVPATDEKEVTAEQEFRLQKARMAKLQADKFEGALIDADEVLLSRVGEIHRAKARLLGLTPSIIAEVAPYLQPLDNGHELIDAIRERADARVAEALIELARDEDDEALPFEDFDASDGE